MEHPIETSARLFFTQVVYQENLHLFMSTQATEKPKSLYYIYVTYGPSLHNIESADSMITEFDEESVQDDTTVSGDLSDEFYFPTLFRSTTRPGCFQQ